MIMYVSTVCGSTHPHLVAKQFCFTCLDPRCNQLIHRDTDELSIRTTVSESQLGGTRRVE